MSNYLVHLLKFSPPSYFLLHFLPLSLPSFLPQSMLEGDYQKDVLSEKHRNSSSSGHSTLSTITHSVTQRLLSQTSKGMETIQNVCIVLCRECRCCYSVLNVSIDKHHTLLCNALFITISHTMNHLDLYVHCPILSQPTHSCFLTDFLPLSTHNTLFPHLSPSLPAFVSLSSYLFSAYCLLPALPPSLRSSLLSLPPSVPPSVPPSPL